MGLEFPERQRKAAGGIIYTLLHRVTFVTPGVPALVPVGVAEDESNPNVSQLEDKRRGRGRFWICFKDKINK